MEQQTVLNADDYVIRVLDSPLDVDATAWNRLLFAQSQPTPFMRHEFLSALHSSGCATADTEWPRRPTDRARPAPRW